MRSNRSRRVSQSDHITIVRFRKQFSLRTLLIVTCFLGMNFAWVPWPACAVLGAAIVLPLFIVGPSIAEWIVIYCCSFVLAALLIPAAAIRHGPRTPALPSTAPPAGTADGITLRPPST
jgi:hypothetical protein